MPVPERLEIAPRSTDPTGKDDRALMPIPNKPVALVNLRKTTDSRVYSEGWTACGKR